MSGIVVVLPYLPYPARANGMSVRFAPIIDALAEEMDLHLVVVGHDPSFLGEGEVETRAKCKTLTVIKPKQHRITTRLSLVQSILLRPAPPWSLLYPLTRQTYEAVTNVAQAHACQTILTVGDNLSHAALLCARRLPALRHVIDWVDSPSLHLIRRGALACSTDLTDAADVAKWERKVNAHVSRAIYISQTDAFHANADIGDRIRVLPNGLVDDFPIEREHLWRTVFSSLPRITLGFLGNMGYEPNNAAAIKLCKEILPEVQGRIPHLEVHVRVVGRNPSTSLRALASERVRISGAVESIWDDVEQIDVFVFPMMHGAGMQNKVLEGMRARRPIVASSLCAGGLPLTDHSCVLIAESPSEVAATILKLVEVRSLTKECTERNQSYLTLLASKSHPSTYIRSLF